MSSKLTRDMISEVLPSGQHHKLCAPPPPPCVPPCPPPGAGGEESARSSTGYRGTRWRGRNPDGSAGASRAMIPSIARFLGSYTHGPRRLGERHPNRARHHFVLSPTSWHSNGLRPLLPSACRCTLHMARCSTSSQSGARGGKSRSGNFPGS